MNSELRALRFSAIVSLVMAILGISFWIMADSAAVLLDCLFNFSYMITGLLTLKVADLVKRPDNDDFPFGYEWFEPLINGLKGFLILGICLFALLDSLEALFEGGRQIDVGPAILYGAIATAICGGTAIFLRRSSAAASSPLVATDAASWTVNTVLATGVLLTFCSILFFEAIGASQVVPYVDPVLVIILVIASVAVPARIAWQSVLALINRAPALAERRTIEAAVRGALDDLPIRSVYVRSLRPGRTLNVSAYVVLSEDYPISRLGQLDDIRSQLADAIQHTHGSARVSVEVLFTADERWAAPASVET